MEIYVFNEDYDGLAKNRKSVFNNFLDAGNAMHLWTKKQMEHWRSMNYKCELEDELHPYSYSVRLNVYNDDLYHEIEGWIEKKEIDL